MMSRDLGLGVEPLNVTRGRIIVRFSDRCFANSIFHLYLINFACRGILQTVRTCAKRSAYRA